MSIPSTRNRVRELRLQHGWSQSELAERAGISRTAVSAIEGERLVPAVTTALSLARVFDVSVESLFGDSVEPSAESRWAWEPPRSPWRYWQAEVDHQVRLYPVERTGEMNPLHDGVARYGGASPAPIKSAAETLVMASCDPAAGVLAREYQRQTGLRLIVLVRSSRAALDLLRRGQVHVAGLHYAHDRGADQNERIAGALLGGGFRLLRVAEWQEGVAYSGADVRSVRGLTQSRRRWVGREEGSAARACQDRLLPKTQTVEHVAADHRGVAAAIQSGWADAGVCVRLVSEDAGLHFLTVQQETYELCFPEALEHDRRIQSLILLIQSVAFRSLIGELPGYDTRHAGELKALSGGRESSLSEPS